MQLEDRISRVKIEVEERQAFLGLVEALTVGLPPRGFRELSWTRPPVYEIPFRENFCWTGQTAGGGSNLTPTVIERQLFVCER